MADLFPVFDIPEEEIRDVTETADYKGSAYFDFASGDFRRDGGSRMMGCSGSEAYIQWCIKTVLTERTACLAYEDDIGTELEAAMAQADLAAVESAVERTITEALLVNPRTEYVRDFVFTRQAGDLRCSFTIKGMDMEEQQVGVTIPRE